MSTIKRPVISSVVRRAANAEPGYDGFVTAEVKLAFPPGDRGAAALALIQALSEVWQKFEREQSP